MKIDVIITSEGDAAGVAESLKWLGHQTVGRESGGSWRALVVENGLEDATAEVVDRFCKEQKRDAAVLIPPKNRSPGGMRNAGVAASDADRMMVLRSGDKLLRRSLERLSAAATLGGYGAAVGGVSSERDGERLGRSFFPPASLVGLRELLDGYLPFCCGVLLDRSLLEGKRYGVNLDRACDFDLLLRIAEEGVRLRSCEAVVALRRPVPMVAVPQARPGAAAGGDAGAEGGDEGGGLLEWHASEIESVLRRSYKRAAAKGWDEEELSEAREAAAVARWGLILGTMAALVDTEERLSQATGLLGSRAFEACVTAADAAVAAATALRLLEGFTPDADGQSEKAWSRGLHRWWSRCISERWAERGFIEDALAELAETLVSDERVATHLIEQLGMPGDLIVTGASVSAFAVGDVAAKKGWNVKLVPLGGVKAASALAGASGERYSVVDGTGASDERDPLVVSLDGEAEALERFAGRPNVLRWSGTRRQLVDDLAKKLRAAWPRRGESADLDV
ncbi:MAG: glycosyltransferase [Planctomycetota bacterium]